MSCACRFAYAPAPVLRPAAPVSGPHPPAGAPALLRGPQATPRRGAGSRGSGSIHLQQSGIGGFLAASGKQGGRAPSPIQSRSNHTRSEPKGHACTQPDRQKYTQFSAFMCVCIIKCVALDRFLGSKWYPSIPPSPPCFHPSIRRPAHSSVRQNIHLSI